MGTSVGNAYPSNVFASRIVYADALAPVAWFIAGAMGFWQTLSTSLMYGGVFAAAVMGIGSTLLIGKSLAVFVPLGFIFIIVAPAASAGFLAIARDLETGRKPTFRAAVTAFRGNARPMLWVGLTLLMLLTMWMHVSNLAAMMTFPSMMHDPALVAQGIVFTTKGHFFLLGSVTVSLMLASLVFACVAFAMPLLLDGEFTMIEAFGISVAAVEANIPAMVVWAALLLVATAIGIATAGIGLAVTLPIAGQATWQGYRAIIRQYTI